MENCIEMKSKRKLFKWNETKIIIKKKNIKLNNKNQQTDGGKNQSKLNNNIE